MSFLLFLAAAEMPTPEPGTKASTFLFTDLLLIIAIVCVLMAVILAWVVFVRGPRQQGPAMRIYKDHHGSSSTTTTKVGGLFRHRRRKKRRIRRREHRQRNPTLAEAGGLPPDQQPQTPPAQA